MLDAHITEATVLLATDPTVRAEPFIMEPTLDNILRAAKWQTLGDEGFCHVRSHIDGRTLRKTLQRISPKPPNACSRIPTRPSPRSPSSSASHDPPTTAPCANTPSGTDDALVPPRPFALVARRRQHLMPPRPFWCSRPAPGLASRPHRGTASRALDWGTHLCGHGLDMLTCLR